MIRFYTITTKALCLWLKLACFDKLEDRSIERSFFVLNRTNYFELIKMIKNSFVNF